MDPRMRNLLPFVAAAACLISSVCHAQVRVATFSIDVTIPIGHRCMGVLETKAQQIDDALELIGLTILSDQPPIVLVAIDWCEIRNGSYDQWRDAIADAAGTTRQRVVLSSLHQHDAPVTDSGAQDLLDSVGLHNELYDVAFQSDCIERAAAAITKSIALAKPVTHIGIGQAEVLKIASNRRVEYPDGAVRYDRYSRSSEDSAQASLDRGLIDPMLKSISFWNDEQPIAVVSEYATHPMSYYGRGGVSADFVGLARRRRQTETPGVTQIYLTGCSGDVTAGKYNDGFPATRGVLADRLYQAIKKASDETTKHAISGVQFRCEQLTLPFHEGQAFGKSAMTAVLNDAKASEKDRILAAMGLSSLARVQSGQPIDLPCIDFGVAQMVLLPGESFVGYQLMAQQIRSDSFVMPIGFGECWTGYIPTRQALDEGFGHGWRWVGQGCEAVIRERLNRVLNAAQQ